MQVLSKIEKKVKVFGALATLYRRSCQTTLRCCTRKGMVVNGQRKAFLKRQVGVREMNASELLMK
jgi:CII-binding regulator of phage lambda lysogenization HflD